MSNLMALGITLSLIDHATKPLSEVKKNIGVLQGAVKNIDAGKLEDEIESISQKTTKLSSLKTRLDKKFSDAAKEAERFKKALYDTERELKRINNQKLSLDTQLKRGKISAEQYRQSIEAIERKTAALNTKKLSLGQKYKQATSNAETLKRNIARVSSQIDRLNGKKLALKAELDEASKSAQYARENLTKLATDIGKVSATGMAAGLSILSRFSKAWNQSAETRQAQGDIASLGINEDGIKKITATAKKMVSDYYGITVPGFIKASYDIKSGIASLSDAGVAEYTRLAALTARATKASTEEMTKLFALGYGIFKDKNENDFNFGKRFSAAISTAVRAFRTDGRDLTIGITNVGAVAKKMGVTLEEELAVIGNAKSAFGSAAEAGTAYRAFLANAVGAQKKLGLSFVDTNGKLLPMRMILEQVRKKFGELDAIEMKQLKDAFGSEEAVKIITALIDKTDSLKKSELALLQADMKTVESMAKSRNRGHEFGIMMQKIGLAAQTIGNILQPLFSNIYKFIGWIADGIANINTDNIFVRLGIQFFAVTAAIVTLASGIGIAISGFMLLGNMLTGTVVVTKMLSMAMFALNVVMSPVFLTMVAIAGAAYLIWDNWSALKTWFGEFWEGLKGLFESAEKWMVSTFSSAVIHVTQAWTAIPSWFGSLFSAILENVRATAQWIVSLFSDPVGTISKTWTTLKTWFGEFWTNIVGAFKSGSEYIANIFVAPIAWIRKMWDKLLAWLDEKINKIKGLVNAGAKFLNLDPVFDVVNLKDKDQGDNGEKTFVADAYSGTHKILKPLKEISVNTKKIPKLNTPTVAPLTSTGASTHTRRSRSSGSGGGTTVSTTASGGKNYTININVVVDQARDITSQLASVLPDLIRDIESGQLARGLYDL